MGNLVLLATEAGSEGGFGLNFNILETNLINLAIVLGLLVYYGRGFLGKVLGERQARIEEAVQEAEQRLQNAAAALAEQQEKLTRAQTEAERIKAEARDRAQILKARIAAQATEDVERMKASASRDLEADREKAIAQLRALAVSKALERAESQLRERLDENAQQKIVDRSLALLGGGS